MSGKSISFNARIHWAVRHSGSSASDQVSAEVSRMSKGRSITGPRKEMRRLKTWQQTHSARKSVQASRPWHCLYFFPLPQGQGKLHPNLGKELTIGCCPATSASAVGAN